MNDETLKPHATHQSFLRHWGSLIVLSLALAIIVIDTTLLNVSLATIIRDLGTDIQHLQWVITAYALTLAALTITGGRLGDIFGRKRMFLLGAILFAIGSFTASEAHNFATLLLGESFIEGIGAALMMPATASLLLNNFRGRDRAIAFGVWGGIAAAASAIGPVLGGFLTTNYSWRWGFRINVFVVLILLLSSGLVKEARETDRKVTLDFPGVILSALGLTGIVFGIVEASTYGWWTAKTVFTFFGQAISFGSLSVVPVSIFAGLVVFGLFLLWEAHVEKMHRTPLVSLGMFKNAVFSSGLVTLAVLSLGQAGLLFAIPVFLQTVRGLDALHTGLALLPLSVTLLIFAPLSAIFSKKIAPKTIIQTGLLINVAALLLLWGALNPNTTVWQLAPGLALYGAGMGMIMSQISNLVLSAVPLAYAGEASGVNNTVRQIGSSLGSAIVGSILITALSSNLGTGIQNSTVIPVQNKPAIVRAVAAQSSNIEFSGVSSPAGTSPVITNELTTIVHQATTDSNRLTLLYTSLFAILGFLVSFWLPNRKQQAANIESHGDDNTPRPVIAH